MNNRETRAQIPGRGGGGWVGGGGGVSQRLSPDEPEREEGKQFSR